MENQLKTLKGCKQQSGAWTPAQGGGLGAGSTRGDPGKGWRGPCPRGEPPAALPPPTHGQQCSASLPAGTAPGNSSLLRSLAAAPTDPLLAPCAPTVAPSPFPSHPCPHPHPRAATQTPAPTTTRPPRPHTGDKSLGTARLGAGGANPPPVSAPHSPLQVLGGSGRSPRDAQPGDGRLEPLGGRFGVQPGTLSSSLCPSPVCVSQALNFFS